METTTRKPTPIAEPSGPKKRFRARLFHEGRHADRLHLRVILANQIVGGALMLAATIIALLWANLGASSYEAFTHQHIFGMSLAHWAADGLLTIFFFAAGMELKREFVEGALSNPADALIPIVAAATGMIVPALIYVGINATNPLGHMHGWAIPMATDIAFALAVLALVGRGLPTGLRAFLLTLAIVDDLGAILVIAIFFSQGVNLLWLGGTLAIAAVWGVLQHRKLVENGWFYVPLGIGAWYCMLQSGVHATIAGVLLGLLVRTRETEMHDPLDRWMHRIEPISAGVVVPIFALVAAGVSVAPRDLLDLWHHPVALGVILGLVAGKTIGVFLGARITSHFTSATLPEHVSWRDVFAVSVLAGIGFTVSMLISELAFPGHAELTASAKTGVLVASTIAALIGGVLLSLRGRKHAAAMVTD